MKTLCLLEEKLRDPLALSRLSQFRYIEVNKKESVQNINREHEFLLCFVLKGSICILKNKIDHAPCVLIHACNVVAPYLHSRAEIASFFHKALTNNLPFFVNVMTNYKFCRTSKELALRCNYNEPVFSRVFKEAFRDTPYRWLQKQTAAEIEFKLKEESVPIKQIMLEYNFKTFSHFTTFCRRNLGASPNEIRRNYTGDCEM